MEFRPCIDIHNGKVKQIVGSSLKDEGNQAVENFVADKGARDYALLYKENKLKGGHIILLNSADSEYYEATKKEALEALSAYPGGMQIGGGITLDNAEGFIEAGASHLIVTSYVFKDGLIHLDRLKALSNRIGRNHLVLDLSCRKTEGGYVITTDRWQKNTKEYLNRKLLENLSEYCDEYLIHAVDVEGKSQGIEEEVVDILNSYEGNPITYAGGIHCLDELRKLKRLGNNHIHATIGSALDLFGGNMNFQDVIKICRE